VSDEPWTLRLSKLTEDDTAKVGAKIRGVIEEAQWPEAAWKYGRWMELPILQGPL